jgi:SAM-dependent methyltransferase
VISGGDEKLELGASVNFFSLLTQPQSWSGISTILIGASLEAGFDTCLLEALAAAASRVAGHDMTVHCAGNPAPLWQPDSISREGLALGRWLAEEIAASGGDDDGLSPSELEYIFGSGGHRASAMVTMLRANYAGRRFHHAVDLGAGIGFISYLVAQKSEFGVRHTVIAEPQARRVVQGRRLWAHGDASAEFQFLQLPTQKFPFQEPTDLAIVCHSLFYVPEDMLAEVIRRGWDALRPGGLFVINEHVRDEPAEATQKRATLPILEREALIALVAARAMPKVYLRRDGWTRGYDPAGISAREFSTDNFLVLEKP